MVELAEFSFDRNVFYVQVGRAAETGDGLLQDLFGLRGTLVGRQNIFLRDRANRSRKCDDRG